MMERRAEVRLPRPLLALLLAAALAGAVAFWVGAASNAQHAWKIFLINFLFWSGISISGLVWSAVLELTHAGWAGPVRRVAESLAGFLPVSLLLYCLLLRGSGTLYRWIEDPPAGRAGWFTFSSFALRETLAFALLYGIGLVFLLASRRRRRQAAGRSAGMSALAVVLLLVYALAFSLIAIDLVMSLDPNWVSTLFPAYFFMGNLYGGIAAIAALSFLWRRWTGAREWLDDAKAHDLGKLLFGFCLLWTYLFWSQYLVIWYGNLPEEIRFLVQRSEGAWPAVSWMVLALCFAVPFVTLLGRAMKRPGPLFYIALVALAGVWLERFLLVMPAGGAGPEIGWAGLLVSLGFLALFVLAQAAGLFWISRAADRSGGVLER